MTAESNKISTSLYISKDVYNYLVALTYQLFQRTGRRVSFSKLVELLARLIQSQPELVDKLAELATK